MIESLKGTEDILPPDSGLWQYLENAIRGVLSKYRYEEIRTPVIEQTSLFIRSVGKETDIVQKQMYTFMDAGNRSIALRPEETASVVRAYIQHNLYKTKEFVKLFYLGTMYRSEKPQSGRQREFTQAGVEVIGSYSPYVDCEIIMLLDDILKAMAVKDYTFKINSLGCDKDKENFKKQLKDSLKKDITKFCPDCQRRYDTNILRVLDCKNPSCKNVLNSLKLTNEHLCSECSIHFNKIMEVLSKENIEYKQDPFLVRGLDYYTKTVFEVTSTALGAQDAIAAGGRYDNLVAELGGPKQGACGFALGLERAIKAIDQDKLNYTPDGITLFIASMNEDAYRMAFKILRDLRKSGIACDMDFQDKSLKAQMRHADKLNAKFVAVIGEDELKTKEVNVKDMKTGSQQKIKFEQLASYLH